MRKLANTLAVVSLLLAAPAGAGAAEITVAVPDGSVVSTPGTYGAKYIFLDLPENPESPDRWDITASDLTFQGQFDVSDINAKARWNTYDDDLDDDVDKLGAYYQMGPYAGSGHCTWWCGVEWTGGGDDAGDIRHIFHMQDLQGTQPDPKYYTAPYTEAGWEWLDDWIDFKMVVHATSNVTGTAQLWIHNELVSGQGQTSPPPDDTLNFDITGGSDDLTNLRFILYVVNGNHPDNPSYTFAWRDMSITGTPVPEPATLGLLGLGLAAAFARRRRKR